MLKAVSSTHTNKCVIIKHAQQSGKALNAIFHNLHQLNFQFLDCRTEFRKILGQQKFNIKLHEFRKGDQCFRKELLIDV